MSANGGITKGKSHKEGGIPMVVKSTGQNVELEGGEGVINKRNMASSKKYSFQGKELTACEIASEINSADGNGVEIECDDVIGKKYKFDDGGIVWIDYGDNELIMYDPDDDVYYAKDVAFDTLEEAQAYIDSGDVSDDLRGAYERGLFGHGGTTGINKYKDEIPYDAYSDIFSDDDNDGLTNVDDSEPKIKSETQIEEVSLTEELKSIIDYRNSYVLLQRKILRKIQKIDCGKIKCEIKSRVKTPYSIVNKLKRRSLTNPNSLEQLDNKAKTLLKNKTLTGLDLYKGLTDVLGFAIIVDDYKQLQKVKDAIEDGFLGKVLEMEDFYKKDKDGYRAVHFILAFEYNKKVMPYELQLKTHRVNELSKITHTIYKKGIMDGEANDRIAKKIELADKGDVEMQKIVDEQLKNASKLTKELTLKKYKNGGDISDEIEMGTRHEMEHADTINKFKRNDISTRNVAKAIATDHIKENKNYYNYLKVMEKQMNKGLSGHEVHKALMDYDKVMHKKRNKRKFAMGGSMPNKESVHIIVNEDYRPSLYHMNSGEYLGESVLRKNELNHLYFIENDGHNSTFIYPRTDYYIMIPNSIIEVKGYSKKYEVGGNIQSYDAFKSFLSTSDVQVLDILRSVPANKLTHQDLEFISTFRGNNVVNSLSTTIITKLFGLMFKNHTISHPIKNLLISNCGTGNLLNLAPTYLDNIFVDFVNNDFRPIEEQINLAQNGSKVKFFQNSFKSIDAIVHVYEKTNPIQEDLHSKMIQNKNGMVVVGIGEFSSHASMREFEKQIENYRNRNININIYRVSEGITNRGKHTLIYILNTL